MIGPTLKVDLETDIPARRPLRLTGQGGGELSGYLPSCEARCGTPLNKEEYIK